MNLLDSSIENNGLNTQKHSLFSIFLFISFTHNYLLTIATLPVIVLVPDVS